MLFMGKSTFSMAIFHSFLYVHQRVYYMIVIVFFFKYGYQLHVPGSTMVNPKYYQLEDGSG